MAILVALGELPSGNCVMEGIFYLCEKNVYEER
uniref:Uncharacterized protein n=1 Tax=Siphoviridae sp. ctJ0s2 TaxID=2827834 RepID=A0A8S5TEU8_9CAUD|nr:MAG TPA: hypothetical protein [Siphoviridae sp. ctJ0s2]